MRERKRGEPGRNKQHREGGRERGKEREREGEREGGREGGRECLLTENLEGISSVESEVLVDSCICVSGP